MLKRWLIIFFLLLNLSQATLASGGLYIVGATVDKNYTEGNRVLIETSTVKGTNWLNDVQDGFIGIVEGRGRQPVKGDRGQLLKTLQNKGLVLGPVDILMRYPCGDVRAFSTPQQALDVTTEASIREEGHNIGSTAKLGFFKPVRHTSSAAKIVNGISGDDSVLAWDTTDGDDRLVGLQQNFLEQDDGDFGTNTAITSGNIVSAPLFQGSVSGKVDIIAHWYNDFGLEYTRSGNGANGALTWYYWSWAHHDNSSGYDASRHPLLGWYRGDDANVLGWQCYWLLKAGIKAVNIGGAIDSSAWSDPRDRNFWKYQLFNNVPNFKKLKYIPWVKWAGNSMDDAETQKASVLANWQGMINDFARIQYPNIYMIKHKNSFFPVVYLWDGELLRGLYDNYSGATNTVAFLKARACDAKLTGFGGLAVFVRNPTSSSLMNYKALERDGLLYIQAGYSNMEGAKGSYSTYSEMVSGMTAPTKRTIVNVVTSHESKDPHPSGWTQWGSTPALFEEALRKAVKFALNDKDIPDIVQIYNVAEWAEGGPGLQPNMQDGFGYLDAVKNVVSTKGPPPSLQGDPKSLTIP